MIQTLITNKAPSAASGQRGWQLQYTRTHVPKPGRQAQASLNRAPFREQKQMAEWGGGHLQATANGFQGGQESLGADISSRC